MNYSWNTDLMRLRCVRLRAGRLSAGRNLIIIMEARNKSSAPIILKGIRINKSFRWWSMPKAKRRKSSFEMRHVPRWMNWDNAPIFKAHVHRGSGVQWQAYLSNHARFFQRFCLSLKNLPRCRKSLRQIGPVLLIRSFIAMFFSYSLTEMFIQGSALAKLMPKNSFDTFVDIYLHGILKETR